MAAEFGPALGLTADSKGIVAATDDLKDIARAAAAAEKAANELSSSNKQMSSSFSASLSVLKSMDASLIKLAQSQQKQSNESDEAARKAASLKAQYEQLRGAMDPLYANSKKYEFALETLNSAQAAGVISNQEYQRSLTMLDAQYDALTNKTISLGQNTASVGNVFAQFNDIGMMAFAGQSPWLLAIQQGTQLNQVFTELRGSGASVGQVMQAAFMQMVNPLNLLTFGLIAGGAALLQWGMSALSSGKEAKTVGETMDEMSSAVEKYIDSAERASAPTLELAKDYGALSLAAREALENIAEADRIEAMIKINEALKASIEGVTSYSWTGFNQGLDASLANVGRLSSEWANMSVALEQVRKAQTDVERIAAAKNLSSEMMEAYGSIDKMPKPMRELYSNLQNVITNISSATSQTSGWAGAMSSVLSYVDAIRQSLNNISGSAIQLASIKAETDLLKQGKSLREASFAAAKKTMELEGAQRTAELEAQHGWWGKILGVSEQLGKGGVMYAQQELDVQRDLAREREKDANKAETKGAAELKAAQKGFQSLRELMEEESIFEFAEYEKRQAQLDVAYEKRLLSEQMYQQMRTELRALYFGSDWEIQAVQYQMDQDALQLALDNRLITEEEYYRKRKELLWANLMSDENRSDLASDLGNWSSYFGNLQQMSGSNSDKMLRIQQGLGAAQALMNAWVGYTTVLADPTVPFWGKLAAAGSVLAAGLGAVRAVKGASSGSAPSAAASTAASAPSRASSASSTATAAAKEPEPPLRVSIDAFDPGQLYTGAAVQQLFSLVQKEAGNRGIIWVPTN